MKPVSTATRRPAMWTSTVLEWPPMRASLSKTSTSCRLDRSHAADSPEIPVPITAMLWRAPVVMDIVLSLLSVAVMATDRLDYVTGRAMD